MPYRFEMVAMLPRIMDAEGGMSIPPRGGRPPGCALVRFKDNANWELLDGDGFDWFFAQFQTREGKLSVWTDLQAYGKEKRWLFDIQAFNLNGRPSAQGCVVLGRDGYVCTKFTHYWRVLDVKNLSPDEKASEASALVSEEFWPVVGAKFKNMLTLQSAAWMVLLGVMFASGVAEVITAACILVVGLSMPILADDYAKISNYVQNYKQKVLQAKTEDDLREAAKIAAEFLVALLEALFTVGADFAAIRHACTVREAKAAMEAAKREPPVEPAPEYKIEQAKPRETPSGQKGYAAYQEWVRKCDAAEAQANAFEKQGLHAEANLKRLDALQAAAEAELSISNLRVMKGHAMVVESVTEWAGKNVWGWLKGKSEVQLIAMFREVGIKVTPFEAVYLRKRVPYLRNFRVKGHDWTFPWDKHMAPINEGMKYPTNIKLLSKEMVEALEKGDVKRFETLAEGSPTIKKWWENSQVEAIRRVREAQAGVTAHSTNSPHHMKAVGIYQILEKCFDVVHSKLMVERGYQPPQDIDSVSFFASDGPELVAQMKLAWYSYKVYLRNGGKYSLNQITHCSQLATDIARVGQTKNLGRVEGRPKQSVPAK